MKSNLVKIIYSFCIIIFVNACHTFEHQNIFLDNIKRNLNQDLSDIENKNSKIIDSDPKKSEMTPINLPKKKEKVQKLTLPKKVKILNLNSFNLNQFKNWNEFKLIKKLGKSNFIKEEGKLKNYQYHFNECFLDIFLIKKSGIYRVNYIEPRPTKLNGKININACMREIRQVIN